MKLLFKYINLNFMCILCGVEQRLIILLIHTSENYIT